MRPVLIAHIGPLSMAPALYAKLGYDPVRDFAPITLLATVPNGLVVHPSIPVTSVKDLITLARARPKQVLYASAGSGSIAHLAVVNIELLARVQFEHVPYKGGAPSVRELIAGETSFTMTGLPQLRPHVEARKLRLLAPAGTPAAIVARLNAEAVKAIQSPDVKQRLAGDGAEPVGSTPEQFAAHIRSEVARWGPVIKASGAKPE